MSILTDATIVNETIKLDNSEIETIKKLTQEFQQTTFVLGQIQIQRMSLTDHETRAKDEFKRLQREEAQLAQQLSSRYGKGEIDLTNGVFIRKP